ncbi:VWA domain-containing protein [Blastopirellula sp. JC732]|uniref:VWA domain-containing protein n=1 Tax=Blastopirellula sediminis TaxID=2894196 RepID=A0A9X1SHK5_9BACT|nr:VWA domain-containing protein [Blastopirellula sediminis]MCC9606148.1 VWA domain-containing protein [Blastopirellula sediminis]MCC9630553.1 VWA domain-containing protein [Blastopirellula sediminis]
MFYGPSAWFLLLLLLVPLIAWRMLSGKRKSALPFSSTHWMAGLAPSWKQRLQWVPTALRFAAIILLIVCLARPQEGRKHTVVDSEGIAIEMVVDRSGSMQAMDFEVDGQPVDRLTAVKDVVGKFISGDDKLSGRTCDLVGLVTFARNADGISPPTLDHPYMIKQLDQTKIATERNEDGTAIGDALGLAVEKLSALGEGDQQKLKSKVVILLTDGENNAGDLDPVVAAELAASLDVKVYTIGVGTKGQAPVPVMDPFTGRTTFQMAQVNIDEATLKSIADATGGQYFRATDTASLEKIYDEIDQLEKSHVEAKHFVDFRELAIEPIHLGMWALPPLALLAFWFLVVEVVLSNTVYRKITE